jgi:fatty-acyl-CoA synthase
MPLPQVNSDILSPVSFLARSAAVYPHKVAIKYGDVEYTYTQMKERVYRLANALLAHNLGRGDKIVFICPNTPPLLEAHFAIPMIGAVLVCVNTDLSSEELSYIINHSDARAVFIDNEFASKIHPIVNELVQVSLFVNICEYSWAPLLKGPEYESFLVSGSTQLPDQSGVVDENQMIAINYTSGTTGRPKGVMYGHRSTYLHSLGEIIESGLNPSSVYLWTLPMFHCNGWCFTWAVTAMGAMHICLRKYRPADIFHLIEKEQVTHLCAVPSMLLTMICYPEATLVKLRRPLQVLTAGASPTPAVIQGMENIGANVIHVYGLTELHGPHSVCTWQSPWIELDPENVSLMKSRQGVPYTVSQHMAVVEPQTMQPVPEDGKTIGEVVMRGNNVMLGYYKDPLATAVAFRDGWFHSGDLGVVHSDGYIQIMDRAKDTINRGEVHIPSMEIETLICRHHAVLEVAVVGAPDPVYGEAPKAFVVVRKGKKVSEEEIISFCRREGAEENLIPSSVEFCQLPKTATGKTLKTKLRDQEWQGQPFRMETGE